MNAALSAHDATAVLPKGSLSISGPRRQLVYRSIPGTYLPDGSLDEDALCLTENLVRIKVTREGPPNGTVVDTNRDRVIWGGCVFSEFENFVARSVSRIWPVLPGGALDGLPVVFNRPSYSRFGTLPQAPALASEWLAALGLAEVELPEQGAVRFERMLVPEPARRVGAWIAPEVRDIHLRAREGMKILSTSRNRHDVLWLSRAKLDHALRAYDESLLEWLLRDHVTRVQPETLTLAEQVGLLEGSSAIAGIAASTFHTLLMAREPPDCVYLACKINHSMLGEQVQLLGEQAQLLDARTTFAPVLAGTMRMRRARESGRVYPGDRRVLVPEAVRALGSSILPNLLDDPRLEAVARLSQDGHASKRPVFEDELDAAMAQVLRDPFSFGDRLTLAAAFEDRGLRECAAEQYAMVAALSEDSGEVRKAEHRRGVAV